MYLKRLELQGFKSFATRTVLDFVPGFTAVVGPNGSGKSNVAESLRWVLGEQQSRSLRARRLEDVIFSGSAQKAAVGMAEVSITLDNSESWLPVDYSEVLVSRRAYRNGESEYLINKNKVRLRDVLDLFMRAQVGQNSYAFMGQGLVEEVLNMRPEERRRLLEEAADVRLLRVRLDESRDRLAATRENLERVSLLIEEIGPRLKQLERQAARASEHERLAHDLAQMLHAYYGHLWAKGQESLAAARAGYDQRQRDLEVAESELKDCDEGLAALTGAIEERERELHERRRRHRDLGDQLHAVEQQASLDAARLDHLTRRRAELEDETSELQAEHSDALKARAAARDRAQAIQQELAEAKAISEARRQELTDLEAEGASFRRRAAEAEDRSERARRDLDAAERGLAELAAEEARVKNDSQRFVDQRRQLIASLKAYGREIVERQKRVAENDRELRAAEQERNGLVSMAESGRESVSRIEAEVAELSARQAKLHTRYEVLRRLQNVQEGVDAGARYLLGESPGEGEEGRVAEGLIGLVKDVIRVPPGLERAIEAALAENVQALVFENFEAAVQALDSLERRQAGRATIYALDSLHPISALNLLREKGIHGVAARLVRCDNRFRPLVDTLLGRVIVVETRNLAAQVIRRGMGSVVTIDGVLLRPTGSVSGGVSRIATEGFRRQRELDELPSEIDAVESRLSELESRASRERESLHGAINALDRIESRRATLREESARWQAALVESRSRLYLLRAEARSLWSNADQGQASHAGWRKRRATLHEARAKAAADLEAAEEQVGRDREALTVQATKRHEAVDAVAEAAAAYAALEGEARSLVRQLDSQAGSSRLANQLKAREEEVKALAQEIEALEGRSGSGEAARAALAADLASLASDLEPAEGEVSQLLSRQRSLNEQLAAARARSLSAERAKLEAEATVQLQSEELAALRTTMENEGFTPEGSGAVNPANTPPAFLTKEGSPPIRGGASIDPAEMQAQIAAIRREIRSLGPVNEQATTDYAESKERYDFLTGQVADLTGSEETLQSAITELEGNIRERLKATFAVVDKEFQANFESFFNGGHAKLELTHPDDYTNAGIDILAQPPGKRIGSLNMLSGGERALTAIALLLALLQANPAPVCVLDEVDAALDETNVGRFVDAVRKLSERTQFIVITHNPRTIEAADVIYGVSMGQDNTSKVLSLRLTDPAPADN